MTSSDNSIDRWGVPVLSADQIERSASDLIRAYNPAILNAPVPTPLNDIIRHRSNTNGLLFRISNHIPDSTGRDQLMGRFFFNPPTIEINRRILGDARLKFTIAHELGHFVLHRNLEIERRDYIPDSDQDIFGEAPPARHWMEWQANRFAAALLVPSDTVAEAVRTALQEMKISGVPAARRARKIADLVSIAYDVSSSMTRYRLSELEIISARR